MLILKSISILLTDFICIFYLGSRDHFSDSWTDMLDRGGLTHVSDTTYAWKWH